MKIEQATFDKIETGILKHLLDNMDYKYITRNEMGDDMCKEFSLNCFKHEPILNEKFGYYDPDSDHWDENENSDETICLPHIFLPMITFKSGIVDIQEFLESIEKSDI